MIPLSRPPMACHLACRRMLLRAAAALAAIVTVGGCGGEPAQAPDPAASDPALSGALNDPIMIDPQLAGQGSGAVAAGPNRVELPPEQRSPEAVAAARAEALRLAGGTLRPAPGAQEGAVDTLVENAATAAQVAAAARAGRTDCAGKVDYSMNWVSALPGVLPVYPRGAVQEAAGTDRDGCRLRVVTFLTPVTPGDVMDFYYTRVSGAGFKAEHRLDGAEHVLGGALGNEAFLIYARPTAEGLTEVDLVASGR